MRWISLSIAIILVLCLSPCLIAEGDEPIPAKIQDLINTLKGEDAKARNAAEKALSEAGKPAVSALVDILKDDNEGFNVSAMYGEYDKDGEGERTTISLNGGLALGENGPLLAGGE